MYIYQIINYLQEHKSYWRIKRKLKLASNNSALKLNKRKEFGREQRIQAALVWSSLRSMPYQFLLAIIFIVVMQIASQLLFHLFNIDFTVKTGANGNVDTLVQLLVVLVTVLGVMLGLYFTALSAVAGNYFLQAPSSLQKLFLNERMGKQYIQTLVVATLVGIFYLVAMSADFKPSLIGPVSLVLICAYVVMRFASLGSQTFYFVHPAEASSRLQDQLDISIKGVMFGSKDYANPTIQKLHHRKALRALDSFDKLVDFSIKPLELSGQQLVALSQYLGSSLQSYFENRNRIPTSSEWFASKTQHQKWLLTEDSSLIVSLNTGTGLLPNIVRHNEWFEERAIRTIQKILRHLIQVKDWSGAQACAEVLVVLAENSGKLLVKTTTALIVNKTIDLIVEELSTLKEDGTDEELEGILSLYEAVGRLTVAALLGLLKQVHDTKPGDVVARMHKIKWGKSGNFYKQKLPVALIPELEKIQKNLDNEKPVEDGLISPQWYLDTLSLHHYYAAIKNYYEYIKTAAPKLNALSAQLKLNNKPLSSASVTSTSMEFTSKLVDLGQDVSELINGSEEFHRIKDLKWVTIDANAEKMVVNDAYKSATERMTDLIPNLLAIPKERRDGLPDFFGQSVITGTKAVYDALEQGDVERFRRVFPRVLVGTLASRENIIKDVEGWLPESQIIMITEPLEDILTLSGMAKIYSELYDDPTIWNACTKAWDGFLSADGVDPKMTIEMLSKAMEYRDADHTITPRDGLRSNWEIRLRNQLEKKEIEVGLRSNPFSSTPPPPVHLSPLIRIVARNLAMMKSEARTVFSHFYLAEHPSIVEMGITLPDRSNFKKYYDLEVERYREEAKDD